VFAIIGFIFRVHTMEYEPLRYNCNCSTDGATRVYMSLCIHTLSLKGSIVDADMLHAKSISTWLVSTMKDPRTTAAALTWLSELEKLYRFDTMNIRRKTAALRKARQRIVLAERALRESLHGFV
jgi:hypothetical protein